MAAKAERKRIAVVPFTELDGRTTVLGGFLAEEVVTHLVNDGFTVVDRATLQEAMSKQTNHAAMTTSAAKAIGTLVHADALITGTVTDLAAQIGINCRVIDTSSVVVLRHSRVGGAVDLATSRRSWRWSSQA